jgi:hypothetical protein
MAWNLLNQLAFTHDVIVREMKLLVVGIKRFVYQDDVKALLDKTRHIKIIELDRYPRVIPIEQMDTEPDVAFAFERGGLRAVS